MNDADIIKALECCFINNSCDGCPLKTKLEKGCLGVVGIHALDLVKRQQAEIERLRGDLDKSIGIDNTGSNLFPFD